MLYVLLIICDVIWGLNIIVTKINYEYFHPLFLVFLKLFFALLTMLVFMKFKKISFEKIKILPLFVNSHLINTFNFLLTFSALTQIKGIISAVLNCLSPFAMMMIIFFDTRKITKHEILLLIFSLFGFYYAIHFNFNEISTGHYLFILALFIYNIGTYRMRKVNCNNIFVFNTYMLLIALIEMTFVCQFVTPVFKPVNSLCLWLFILTSGVGYAFIQCVSFYSIKRLGTLTTSVLLGIGPLFTYIFSIIFLKEKISFQLLVGFAIIFVSSSIYILYRGKTNTR